MKHMVIAVCLFNVNIKLGIVWGLYLPDSVYLKPSVDLPRGWKDVCGIHNGPVDVEFLSTVPQKVVETSIQINCSLPASGEPLVFTELRDWMRHLTTKVLLTIECDADQENQGTVRLPWPFKAPNLMQLTVKGCQITDYYKEYFNSDLGLIPDELRILELTNSVILFDVFQLPELIKNTSFSSPDAECGQVTVEKLTMKNVTYDFDLSTASISDLINLTAAVDLDKLFQTLLFNFENMNFTCNFNSLRVIDESYSSVSSLFRFYLSIAKSSYPRVGVYNLSYSSFESIPKELQEWSLHFPELSVLDLSHNNITDIPFHELSRTVTTHQDYIVYINFQYNNIVNITTDFIEHMLNNTAVQLDIRNNPVLMDCTLYMAFIQQLGDRLDLEKRLANSNIAYLLETPCNIPNLMESQGDQDKASIWIDYGLPLTILCVYFIVIVVMFIVGTILRKRKSTTESMKNKAKEVFVY